MNTQSPLLQQLNQIFARVKQHFEYRPDQGELWTMPPAHYDGSQRLSDDCDGFCLACRHLLAQAGIASRLVYCRVLDSHHLVVEVQGWILDNMQQQVVANTLLSTRQYRWMSISGYEAGEPWREITGYATGER